MLRRMPWLLGSILVVVLLLRYGSSLLAPAAALEKRIRFGSEPEEDMENYERARQEWVLSRTRTQGADAFRLRLEAYKQIEQMRKRQRADTTPAFTQAWHPIASATDNWASIRSSGTVWGLGVDPTNPSTVYAASAGGGIWKTTDSGTSWTVLNDEGAFLANRSFVVDPNSPGTIYSGAAGEASLDAAGGILKSTDGGATWSLLTGPFVGPFNRAQGNAPILTMAVEPGNSQVLLVGTDLPTFALYRSADGGNTWTTPLSIQAPIYDVVFDQSNASVAYAAACGGYAPQNPGLYKSTDAGETWTRLQAGLPAPTQLSQSICRFALSPANSSVLAVLFADNTTNVISVYTSSDAGNSWKQVSSPPLRPLGAGIFFSQTDPNTLFDGGVNLYRTSDGGVTWNGINTGTNGVTLHPDMGSHAWVGSTNQLYLGNDGGVFFSPDATASAITWTNLNNGIATLRLYPGFALHPTDSSVMLVGTQDEGTMLNSSASPGWNSVTCGDSAYEVIDQQNPKNMFANCYGITVQRSTDGGATFQAATSGINTSDPVNFLPPLAGDPQNGQYLYFGTNRVYQTSNGAQSWTVVSPQFSANLNSIAVSPQDSNTVYATDGAKVWVTQNALAGASASWTSSSTGLPGRVIVAVVPDPISTAQVFAILGGYSGFGDSLGHIFKSTDLGNTWTDISGSLPNTPATDLAVDPDVPGRLYLATSVGPFVSIDGGASWEPLGTGLPHVYVSAIRLHRSARLLRVGTFGRGAWDLAVPLPGPQLTFSASSVSFAPQLMGTPVAAQTVQVQSSGSSSFTINSIQISGSNAALFSEQDTCSGTLSPGTSCPITISFAGTSVGNYSAVLTISDTATGNPHTLALSASLTDFSLGKGATDITAASITAGQTANYSLTLGTTNAFSGTVALSCTGAPAQSTCTVYPNSISVSGNPATFAVNVATTARGVLLPSVRSRFLVLPAWLPITVLLVLILMLLILNSTQRRRKVFVGHAFLAVLFAICLYVASCGGGSSAPPVQQGTLAGNYTLTATGTSGTATRTVLLALKVN